MIRASIIMPVYNGEELIEKAIQSILNQTYNDFELLIYDDGSTDNTVALIEKYEDARIKLYKGNSNLGSLKARNYLFTIAQGEYFIFHDADDWSKPNRIETLVAYMDQHECGICGSNVEIYDATGLILTTTNKPIEHHAIIEEFKTSVPIYFPSSIVRREVFETIGGFKEYFYDLGNYDYDWMYRISEKFVCANLNEAFYCVSRLNVSNSTTIKNPHKIIGHKIVQFLAKERAENGYDSLETNIEKVNQFAVEAYKPYLKDKSLYTQDRIVGLLAENFYSAAFKLSLKAIGENPKKLINYRTAFYTLRKWMKNKIS